MIKNYLNLFNKLTGETFIPGDELNEAAVAYAMCDSIDSFIDGYEKGEYSSLELCYFAFSIRHLESYSFLDKKSDEIKVIEQFLLDILKSGNKPDSEYALIAYITLPLIYLDGSDDDIYRSLKSSSLLGRYMDGMKESFRRYDSMGTIPRSVDAYIGRVLREAYDVWENYQSDVGGTEYAFQQFLNSEFNFMFFRKEMEFHI